MNLNLISKLHNSTKREYLSRMINKKVSCMKEAKKYGKNYWDGDRKFGYGGYKYIPGRWSSVAKKLIKIYKLKAGSKILDVGCGKGFLLFEMLKIEPNLNSMDGMDKLDNKMVDDQKAIRDLINTQEQCCVNTIETDLALSINKQISKS